jgi:uncharacterized YigZ family protein
MSADSASSRVGSEVGYSVPAAVHRVEQTVERSRFITTIGPARTADEAHAFIDGIRAEFSDATHNCWAFVAGPPGTTASIGLSDAGEPHGTAGRPMLDVLLHSDVGDVVVVVTRYYGGTKLGKGGLARAYGGGVQHALQSMPRAERVDRLRISVTVDYADVDPLRRLLADFDAELLHTQYGERVTYEAAAHRPTLDALSAALLDSTAGRARITRSEG